MSYMRAIYYGKDCTGMLRDGSNPLAKSTPDCLTKVLTLISNELGSRPN